MGPDTRVLIAAVFQIHRTGKCRSYARNGADAGFVSESAEPIRATGETPRNLLLE